MSERGYYRWLGKTMMTLSVILPVFITLLFIVILFDTDGYIDISMREAVGVFLGIFAVSGGGFFVGRMLSKIPSH
ncbi:MAG: hypothetical protein Q8S03_15725 [Brevundimonas sp.]|uniref:hypothetical protein n=1 Tax=Brevundimonas sp. TaxID=1871086 RepID=UPI002735AA22|nr:hypothetical protein [Brevundimonas sp.]MDP3406137.1 hypothetical protein [Brevundimonas sp.]